MDEFVQLKLENYESLKEKLAEKVAKKVIAELLEEKKIAKIETFNGLSHIKFVGSEKIIQELKTTRENIEEDKNEFDTNKKKFYDNIDKEWEKLKSIKTGTFWKKLRWCFGSK